MSENPTIDQLAQAKDTAGAELLLACKEYADADVEKDRTIAARITKQNAYVLAYEQWAAAVAKGGAE